MAALAVLHDHFRARERCRGSAGCSSCGVPVFLESLSHSGAEGEELFQSRIPLAIFVLLDANIKAVWVFVLQRRTL